MKKFIKTLVQRIDSIFKNGSQDSWSSQRIMSVALVFIPLIVWVIISLSTWVLIGIPESVVVLVIAGLTGKVVGKYVEKKNEPK